MNQLYFLSVLFNIFCGLILAAEFISEKISSFTSFSEMISGSRAKFIIGATAFVVGVLKLLVPISRMSGTAANWLILGDLLPAAMGMLLGFALLMDFLKQKSVINTDTLIRLDSIIIQNKKTIGFAGIIVALLHFFFGTLMIL